MAIAAEAMRIVPRAAADRIDRILQAGIAAAGFDHGIGRTAGWRWPAGQDAATAARAAMAGA